MSLDLDSRLKRFLASAPQRIYPVQTMQISHSAMSRTYYLWREPRAGQITLDTGAVVTVESINMEIRLAGAANHLDQRYQILLDLADAQDRVRAELDRIPLDTHERIQVVYREYLSDDLAAIMAQATLQAESIAFAPGAATITAVQPRLSMTRTGEIYAPRDVPMLRGFL